MSEDLVDEVVDLEERVIVVVDAVRRAHVRTNVGRLLILNYERP